MSDSAALDAQVLLAHILGRPRTWIMAHPEHTLNREQQHRLDKAEAKLSDGMPLPYVLGEWEFYKLPFIVNQNVLIPRPETEMLVDLALERLGMQEGGRVLDAGTGSGCIAVAVAVNAPRATVLAGDISARALETARANLARHEVEGRVGLIQLDIRDGIPGRFDLILANLPYIPTDKLAGLGVAEHEPHGALDGGEDGLDLVRSLLAAAPCCLAPDGLLLAEIEAGLGSAALELGRQYFPSAPISILPDLGGKDRVLRIAA